MLTYSSCATCDRQITVTEDMPRPPVHDGCPEPTDILAVARRALIEAVQAGDDDYAAWLTTEIDRYNDRPPQLLDAALLYAAWGWPVLPCRPGAKSPATAHGLRDATTDPERIRDWWWRWPRANVGLATGHAFDVVDIDPAGARWWADVRADHSGPGGPVPDVHGIVSTPRPAGSHVYIEPLGRGNLAGLAPGIDFRGRGGYVLAPPSVLDPSAYRHGEVPNRPLTYTWWTYPSPAIKPASASITGA